MVVKPIRKSKSIIILRKKGLRKSHRQSIQLLFFLSCKQLGVASSCTVSITTAVRYLYQYTGIRYQYIRYQYILVLICMRARSADLHAGARSCSTGIYLAIQARFLPVSTGTTGTQDCSIWCRLCAQCKCACWRAQRATEIFQHFQLWRSQID